MKVYVNMLREHGGGTLCALLVVRLVSMVKGLKCSAYYWDQVPLFRSPDVTAVENTLYHYVSHSCICVCSLRMS